MYWVLFEKFTNFTTVPYPTANTIKDKRNSFLSFVIQKKINKILIMIIRGEKRLRIERRGNIDGLT